MRDLELDRQLIGTQVWPELGFCLSIGDYGPQKFGELEFTHFELDWAIRFLPGGIPQDCPELKGFSVFAGDNTRFRQTGDGLMYWLSDVKLSNVGHARSLYFYTPGHESFTVRAENPSTP